ncbi:creatininase family protein [Desulfuromonas carbonis]
MLITDLTMDEFTAGLAKTRTVLIPFGSTEEHGPHLPLDTDTIQAYGVARRLAERRPIFIAPPIHYGVCRSTGRHPGTLSISTATLRALVLDIAASLYAQGLRNIILLTGHAGVTHCATLTDAGEELLARYPEVRVAVLNEYQLTAETGRHLIETRNDAHAGEIETSRILYSHPQLVKGSAAEDYPNFPKGILVRDKQRFWRSGVWGNPGKATADKGKRLEEVVVAALEELVAELEAGVEP